MPRCYGPGFLMRPQLNAVRSAGRASAKEVDALFKLDAPARYGHLVRKIADFEQAWGLRSPAGWTTLADDAEQLMFPIWPHAEYVEKCRALGDADAVPASIPLDHLLEVLLPQFSTDGTVIAAFPTPHGRGVPVSAERFRSDLLRECEQYE
jgi:hypothetical protein